MIRNFLSAAALPFGALKLILKNPTLMGWSVAPIVIALALSLGLMVPLRTTLSGTLHQWVTAHGMGESHALSFGIDLFTAILVWILGAVLFSVSSGIVATPFSDFLAEAAEPLSTPPLPQAPSAGGWFSRIRWRRITLDLMKTLLGMVLSLAGVFISWIPVLNFLSIVLISLGISFQFLSFPQTRRDEGIIYSIWFLLKNLPSCLGLGITLMAGFSIPFLSVLILPIGVVSGTLLYAKLTLPAPTSTP
jgi:uncharacterized protein involved in cysteine biosynthesis